jgi:hypothetical protein
MEVKDAFHRMRHDPLKFWYCEKGKDGKPSLLLSLKKIPPADIAEAKKGAQAKVYAHGEMMIDGDGVCHVIPAKEAPHSLAKSVQIVARNNNVMPKAIVVDPPVPDDEDAEAEAEGGAPPAPLLTQTLRPGYEDEDKKLGWRTASIPEETKEKFGITPERADIAVTSYVTDEAERRKLAITADEKGRAWAAARAGNPSSLLADEKVKHVDFVIDPKNQDVLRVPSEDKRARKVETNEPQVTVHHSTPLAGGAVAGAGSLQFDKGGHVTRVDDQSGHYKPGIDLTHQAVGILDKQGLLTNREPSDAKGRSLRKALEKLGPVGKQLGEKYIELNDKLANSGLEPAERAAVLVRQDKLMEALAKHGIAPRNSEARVSVLGKASMVSPEEFDAIKGIGNDAERIKAAQTAIRRKTVYNVVGSQEYAALQQRVTTSAGAEIQAKEARGQVLSAAEKNAIRAARYKAEVEGIDAASIADLKARLGEKALEGKSEKDIAKLARKLGIQDINRGKLERNLVNHQTLNFAIGQHTAIELKKSQFLAAGADEEQIRLKEKITGKELKDGSLNLKDTGTAAAEEMRREREKAKAREDIIAELGRVRDRKLREMMERLQGDIPHRQQFEKALNCSFEDPRFKTLLMYKLVPEPKGSDSVLADLARKHDVAGPALNVLAPWSNAAAARVDPENEIADEMPELETAPPIEDAEAERAVADIYEAEASDEDATKFFGGVGAVPQDDLSEPDDSASSYIELDVKGEQAGRGRSPRPSAIESDYSTTVDLNSEAAEPDDSASSYVDLDVKGEQAKRGIRPESAVAEHDYSENFDLNGEGA